MELDCVEALLSPGPKVRVSFIDLALNLLWNFNRHMFHFQFMDPLRSFSVEYKSESNDANDSKKKDSSQLFGILSNILRQPDLSYCTTVTTFKNLLALTI